jgi:hypothetical protein
MRFAPGCHAALIKGCGLLALPREIYGGRLALSRFFRRRDMASRCAVRKAGDGINPLVWPMRLPVPPASVS